MTARHLLAGDATALIAGAAVPLGFAPFGFWPAPVLSLAVVFRLWLGQSPARGLWRGWLFGVGMFGVGVSWVYVSIHRFGGQGAVAAGAVTFGLVVFAQLRSLMGIFLKHVSPPSLCSLNASSAPQCSESDQLCG